MQSESTKGDAEAQTDPHVVLGKIIGFHGVKGWLKVHSETDPRENIVQYRHWLLGTNDRRATYDLKPENWQTISVVNGKRSGKNVIVQLEGIDTREKAETVQGKTIAVLRSSLPAPGQGEVYWTDLIDCRVEDINGSLIGTVKRLFETGANDVLVVLDQRQMNDKQGDRKGQEILIPWIRPSVVTEVDLDEQRIIVDWDPDF